jgi:hypothetical protein
MDPRLRKQILLAPWVKGAEARRLRELACRPSDRPKVTVINVESFSSGDKALDFLRAFITSCRKVQSPSGRWCHAVLWVIDESTVIRNARAKRSEKLMKLRDLTLARRVLTGLMTPKSPLDVFNQYRFLDPRILGYDSPVAFRARYAEVQRACYLPGTLIRAKLMQAMGLSPQGKPMFSESFMRAKLRLAYGKERPVSDKMRMPQIVEELMAMAEGLDRDDCVDKIIDLGGWIQHTVKIKEFRNLDELNAKIAPYSHVVFKKEALPELKEKTYAFWEHELTDEQEKAYAEMKRNATTKLREGHVTARSVVDSMMKLHQIVCGHVPLEEDGRVVDVKSHRPDEILEILEDHEGKAIVWSMFPRACDKIAARLREEYGEGSVAVFHGQNAKTRAEDEARFLGRDKCRFMVSTQMSGGRGNTWNVADLTIYAGNSYDLEWRFQSEDRNHRKGQKAAVKYVDMIVRGTVEERIVSALRRKIDLMSIINGENFREWLI